MGFQNAVNNTINAAAIISTAKKVEEKKLEEQYNADLETVAQTSEQINKANKEVAKTEKKIAPIEASLSNYSTDEEGNVLTKSGRKAGKKSLDKKARLEHDLNYYQTAMSNLNQVIAAKTKIRDMANQRIGVFEGGKK